MSEDYRRFQKTGEDFRRCQKTAEDFQGDVRKIFTVFFLTNFTCERYISIAYRSDFFFPEKPSKHLTVFSLFSPEIVNIKKLARLTADT